MPSAANGQVAERRVRDAYGLSLALVMASVLVSISVRDRTIGLLAAGVLQGLTLVVALQVAGVARRVVWLSTGAAVVATVLAATLTVVRLPLLASLVPAVWALIVLAVIAVIFRHLRRYTSVTLQAVLALLTIYLLVGLLFAYTFMFVDALRPTFFSSGQSDAASYVYFSYVTLATVGYGDLVPAEGLPRALAVVEAILGQLYLVTVVALAVGRLAGRRAAARAAGGSDEPPG